ncbi:MAG: ComEC family competence protein [Geminicoccaceae bacterium]|nr:ComEC family competence protein [Geminicoccaceae bacterium]
MHAAAAPPGPDGIAHAALPRPLARAASILGRALLAEADRWFLWLPVGIAFGILLPFAAPSPPPNAVYALAALIAPSAAVLALLLRPHRPLASLALGTVAAIGLGSAAFGLRLATVAAPVLEREGVYALEGRVVELEPRGEEGVRILLDRVAIADLPASRTPARVRLTVRSGSEILAVGRRIALRARLSPPDGPVVPGDFDFARHAWFERIGAVGWALGRPEISDDGEPGSLFVAIAALRATIARRLAELLPGPEGAVAAALLAGVRAGLDESLWRAFQASGLAHLLSISGLHMTLVAGTVLFLGRWLFALVPPIALRTPARKPAAALALVAAAFYLALSGGSVPTRRAFLMVGAALLAILLDRDPLSLRLLAWAAVLVLLSQPEAVLGPSFQLSFAAVLALIVVWERFGRRAAAGEPGLLARAARYFLVLAGTTLVAGLVTTPLAAFHFHTLPTWSVFANLLAVPLTSFWIMPSGLLALLAMPLGLDEPVVALMGAGIALLLAIARTAAALPGAVLTVPVWPATALLSLWLGFLWLALWRTRLRLLGVFPILFAGVAIALDRPPDLAVTPWLDLLAARSPAGAHLSAFVSDQRRADALLSALGGAAPVDAPSPLRCDRAGCRLATATASILLARRIDALLEACREAGLVIARLGPERCPNGPAALVGPRALARSGGLVSWLEANGTVRFLSVAETRGRWPWVREHGSAADR